MKEIIARVNNRNQVTLPPDVRRQLGVGPSDTIVFVAGDGGRVEIRLDSFSLNSILGSIQALPGESSDLRVEIERATAEEMERKYRRECLE